MGQKRTILIVDDDVDNSQMVKMLLEKTGLYTVSVCNRGSEAVKIIQGARPELVLLDIMMPDADGADIANRIKEDDSLALTKIVFMTSLVSQQEALKNPMIGGHPFISKPISSEILLKRVKGLFEIEN
jgi:two-component system sensor histidine kinase/response regulator